MFIYFFTIFTLHQIIIVQKCAYQPSALFFSLIIESEYKWIIVIIFQFLFSQLLSLYFKPWLNEAVNATQYIEVDSLFAHDWSDSFYFDCKNWNIFLPTTSLLKYYNWWGTCYGSSIYILIRTNDLSVKLFSLGSIRVIEMINTFQKFVYLSSALFHFSYWTWFSLISQLFWC